jgi:hypothetical protein
MGNWMDWNRKRFTIGAEVKVLAIWVHALVANALYQFATTIATGAMHR